MSDPTIVGPPTSLNEFIVVFLYAHGSGTIVDKSPWDTWTKQIKNHFPLHIVTVATNMHPLPPRPMLVRLWDT